MTETDQNRQAETKTRGYASVISDLDEAILDRPSTVPREANLAASKLLCPMRYDVATLEEKLKQVYSQTTQEGVFLEEWAHPQALKELHGAFAHYDGDDIKHALLATMDLFRWIAAETAEKLRYPYPTKVDEHVTKWVRTCLSQNKSVKL